MSKINILIINNFYGTKRISMNNYAISIIKYYKKYFSHNIYIYNFYFKNYIYKYSIVNKLFILYNLYIKYPENLNENKNCIFHIVDHTHTHLIKYLDNNKTIITVHDLLPLIAYKKEIEGYTYPHYPFLFNYSLSYLKFAKYIVAVSYNTKNDLIKYLNIDERNIKVIYNGIDNIFKPLYTNIHRQEFNLNNDNDFVILTIGTLIHKNNLTSIKVFELLEKKYNNIKLVIVGNINKNIIPKHLSKKIINLQNINNEQLVRLYNSVNCLLFPSLYEGFGWPPLEAMSCGIPVIVSNKGSLPEIVGNAAIIIPPFNIDLFVLEISKLIEDIEYKKKYISLGFERIKNFSWEKSIKEYNDLYNFIIEENK